MVNAPLFLAALLAPLAFGEAPIPKTPYGITYSDGSADAPIQIDFFLDLLCPDSRNAYPNVVKLADTYPLDVRVRFHHFPLPYHRNAFVLHQAAQVILNATDDDHSFATWADIIFKNQAVFNESVALDGVTSQIKTIAAAAFPDLVGSVIDQGLKTRQRNLEVRYDFKYGGTRGVYGTPAIFINDIFVDFEDNVTYDRLFAKVQPLL
ncbi:Aste57867_14522 [Aphanomyces stellatus]|uniref:Aste57867_14522 protein n=1 Tax=Aphanomyces stellatus TaxID=120398 RepID=A0A485L0V4_9STRA|nr:hypothetical protein As57867_014468 [Aphanomyces stellatus]VFT91344.1 Aste57867_14522 [Aphanomyces stellatus]